MSGVTAMICTGWFPSTLLVNKQNWLGLKGWSMDSLPPHLQNLPIKQSRNKKHYYQSELFVWVNLR